MEQLADIKKIADTAGVAPADYCRKAIKDQVVATDSSARSWTYQYCTEFGWFQTPSHEHAMRPSTLLGESYWHDYCKEIFGIDNINKTIQRSISEFSGHHTAGTNTIITNGGEDPWQWATELAPNESLNQKGLMADCDDCGHCADLYTPKDDDKPELKAVRE